MLSVAKVSSKQAISYYSGDNYYTKEQEIEQSQWWGRGAAALGLDGLEVRSEIFENLLQAKSPDGKEALLNRKNVRKKHTFRAGTDLTFSAPKSVALAALLDERLLEAHKKAVDIALQTAEEEFATARTGKDRKIAQTKNLLVAKFHHDTARKASLDQHPDPQPHTHCVVLNLTQVEVEAKAKKRGKGEQIPSEKKWMAVHNDNFFNNSKLLGLVYQNAFAKLAEGLGYIVQYNANGTFDIVGYSREHIEAFSKRSVQIGELNASSKKEERRLKLAGRFRKGKNLRRSDLKEYWLEEAKKLGIEHPKPKILETLPLSEQDKAAAQVVQEQVHQEAIASAVSHLSERDVSIAARKILLHAFEHNLGKIESYASLKEQLKKNPELILYNVDRAGDSRYTTESALDRELKIIKFMQMGTAALKPIASKAEIEALVASKSEETQFTKGQREAITSAATTQSFVSVWQGVAGSGKSYALHDFRVLAESKGHKVVGLAPDGASVKVLRDSTKIDETLTVASYLRQARRQLHLRDDSSDTEVPAQAQELAVPEQEQDTAAEQLVQSDVADTEVEVPAQAQDLAVQAKQIQLPDAAAAAAAREIIIVDEAGKLNAREMAELLELASHKQAQVILVGDTRQFSAVEAGNPFKLLQQHGAQVAYLTEHRRQKDPNMKAAVELAATGKGPEALALLKPKVTELKRESSRIDAAAKDYMAMPLAERAGSLILTGTNAERLKLTGRLRNDLRAEGTLGKEELEIAAFQRRNLTNEQTSLATSYRIGDYVIPSTDHRGLGIKRKLPYEVLAIDGSLLTLKGADEGAASFQVNPRDLDNKAVFERFTFNVSSGDKLKWTLNDRELKRTNGQEFIIKELRPDGSALISYEDKREETVDLTKAQHADHALVMTAFSSQGKTADKVLLCSDDTMAAEAIYVALSRVKYDVKIYTADYEKTLENAKRSQAKRSAHDLINAAQQGMMELADRPQKDETLKEASQILERHQALEALTLINPKEAKNVPFEIAKQFASLSPSARAGTLVLAGDQKELDLLNSSIRSELHANKKLEKLTKVHFLVPKKEGQEPERGDVFIPKKGSSFYKLRKLSQYEVLKTHGKLLQLKAPSGKEIIVNQDEVHFNLYSKKASSLALGESFENFQKPQQRGKGLVKAISKSKITVRYQNGMEETLSLDKSKALPFRHTYAALLSSQTEGKNSILFSAHEKFSPRDLSKLISLAMDKVSIFTANKMQVQERFKFFDKEAAAAQKHAKKPALSQARMSL